MFCFLGIVVVGLERCAVLVSLLVVVPFSVVGCPLLAVPRLPCPSLRLRFAQCYRSPCERACF
eukprot:2549612-Prorocentrum_lima.AAC.1